MEHEPTTALESATSVPNTPPPALAPPIIHAPNVQTGNGWPTACGLPEGIVSPVMGNVSCAACLLIWREQFKQRPNKLRDPNAPIIHADGYGTRTACGLNDPKEIVTPILDNATCEKCLLATNHRRQKGQPLAGPGPMQPAR